MTDRIARLRIRSVRMKAGGAKISVIRSEDVDYTASIRSRVEKCLDAQPNPVGFAFVVWSNDHNSVADAANYRSNIPTILIPDFVRNRLLAERIVDWAVEEMKK